MKELLLIALFSLPCAIAWGAERSEFETKPSQSLRSVGLISLIPGGSFGNDMYNLIATKANDLRTEGLISEVQLTRISEALRTSHDTQDMSKIILNDTFWGHHLKESKSFAHSLLDRIEKRAGMYIKEKLISEEQLAHIFCALHASKDLNTLCSIATDDELWRNPASSSR